SGSGTSPAKPFQVDGGRSGGSDDVASSAGSPDRRSRSVAAMDPPDAERAPGPGAVRRDLDVLDLTDVIGKRIVETSHHGRVTVREENTAAALEVMSRYALDPRWLLYLPPTMAPCATSQRPDQLEHPDEAFDAYRRDGVTDLICQEKHMGSRAVVVVCRDRATAQRHFNAEDATGAVYTRTGRSCFSRELTEQLLSRLRAAADDAELWADLKADWLLLDCELLPWSAKAADLRRASGAPGRGRTPRGDQLPKGWPHGPWLSAHRRSVPETGGGQRPSRYSLDHHRTKRQAARLAHRLGGPGGCDSGGGQAARSVDTAGENGL